MPSDGHADIERWMLRGVMPDMVPIVQELDESIRATIPGLQFALKWNYAHYGLPALGWIMQIEAFAVSVNVVFFGGADFDPPPPLGTTDRSRYVKLTTVADAQGQKIHGWIEQAARVPGWK